MPAVSGEVRTSRSSGPIFLFAFCRIKVECPTSSKSSPHESGVRGRALPLPYIPPSLLKACHRVTSVQAPYKPQESVLTYKTDQSPSAQHATLYLFQPRYTTSSQPSSLQSKCLLWWLACFSTLVSRKHYISDSRISQRSIKIKPTVNQKAPFGDALPVLSPDFECLIWPPAS